MTSKCCMCDVTTEDLTGWHLLQVSTAEFIQHNGVQAGSTETLYCHDLACRDAWYARAQVALPEIKTP